MKGYIQQVSIGGIIFLLVLALIILPQIIKNIPPTQKEQELQQEISKLQQQNIELNSKLSSCNSALGTCNVQTNTLNQTISNLQEENQKVNDALKKEKEAYNILLNQTNYYKIQIEKYETYIQQIIIQRVFIISVAFVIALELLKVEINMRVVRERSLIAFLLIIIALLVFLGKIDTLTIQLP